MSLFLSGINPNLADSNGCTALHYAARAANLSVGYVLIQHGTLLNLRNDLGETAFHWAISHEQPGWMEFCKMLADKGADPRALDDAGRSPLTVLKLKGALTADERGLIAAMEAIRPSDVQEVPESSEIISATSLPVPILSSSSTGER